MSVMEGIDARIAESVKAALSRSHISQSKLAAAIGVSQSTIERRLAGTRQWTANDVLKIARHLNIPVSELMGEGR